MHRTSLLSTPGKFGPVLVRENFGCLQMLSIKCWQKRPYAVKVIRWLFVDFLLTFYWLCENFLFTFCSLSVHFLLKTWVIFIYRRKWSYESSSNDCQSKAARGPYSCCSWCYWQRFVSFNQSATKNQMQNTKFLVYASNMGLQCGTVVFW